ncbi:hypothetical protein PoB_005245700 [Plakobranchus ocellatus]|uniref:Uncharacterized protein n=1 Tax=Plakobranchus ocellatus TaxID=259542 RepID=A0AAV4C3W7_9GAST|nr:hypothetical protein PoB_005245700 [Plakobranchus ocellatus]
MYRFVMRAEVFAFLNSAAPVMLSEAKTMNLQTLGLEPPTEHHGAKSLRSLSHRVDIKQDVVPDNAYKELEIGIEFKRKVSCGSHGAGL